MGWNRLVMKKKSRLLEGIDADAYFYFAHTYAAIEQGQETVAVCDYGTEFVAVLEKENMCAVSISSGEERRSRRPGFADFSEAGRMSLARRIIPCLDVDGDRVVKGVNFVGLRDAGDPRATGGAIQRRMVRTSSSCWTLQPRATGGRRSLRRFGASRQSLRFP